MPVGIDFDNTIVSYDRVFTEAARSRGWVAKDFRGTKKQLRDVVRLLDDGEIKWQILQGEVYGQRMSEAEPFPGVIEFIDALRRRGIEMFIVSHKTRYSNYDALKVDLREAALTWMEKNGFFDPARLRFSRDQIFFADTRAEKIAQISALGCGVFIDDLEEVFVDPTFPATVRRVLFTSDHESAHDRAIVVRKTWPDIARYVLEHANGVVDFPDEVAKVGEQLAGAVLRSVRPARKGGGNNRLFRIESEDGEVYALKSYPRQPSDLRDRLSTEFTALEFMRRHGITHVPKPIAKDHEANFALYEWIAGAPVGGSVAAIDAAVAFTRTLHGLRDAMDATSMPSASEACFSAQSIAKQMEARLATLSAQAPAHPELRKFLDEVFTPVGERAVAHARKIYAQAGLEFDAPIDPELRCLSPSDFGFHNALMQADGRIVFLDFEYFGWDDPIKLASDFVLHPGMDLTPELKKRFLSSMSDVFQADKTFDARLRGSLPLYAMRWTMILLNEFLPERWARRVMAGTRGDRSAILQAQLDKARRMVRLADTGDVMA
ncbi:MAG: phosphotransferase [Candidatus Binataceae bacterium]|jgi:hypothetical protein